MMSSRFHFSSGDDNDRLDGFTTEVIRNTYYRGIINSNMSDKHASTSGLYTFLASADYHVLQPVLDVLYV